MVGDTRQVWVGGWVEGRRETGSARVRRQWELAYRGAKQRTTDKYGPGVTRGVHGEMSFARGGGKKRNRKERAIESSESGE
jgi:hypothetical protein